MGLKPMRPHPLKPKQGSLSSPLATPYTKPPPSLLCSPSGGASLLSPSRSPPLQGQPPPLPLPPWRLYLLVPPSKVFSKPPLPALTSSRVSLLVLSLGGRPRGGRKKVEGEVLRELVHHLPGFFKGNGCRS